jgi:hypothetical protein
MLADKGLVWLDGRGGMLDCGTVVERNKEEVPKGRRRLRYDHSNMNEIDHVTEASDNKWLSRV